MILQHNRYAQALNGTVYFTLLVCCAVMVTAGVVSAEECAIDPKADKKDLEHALEQCEKQIKETEGVLRKQQAERTNTEYEILVIDHEINKALVRIQSSESVIKELQGEIVENEGKIGDSRRKCRNGVNC